MPQSLYSQNWYRAAAIQPRIRDHVQLHRHYYRGNRCYMLRDEASGTFHRFSPEVYTLIAQMDGRRTLNEIWETALDKLGEEAPGQDETLQLMGQLHASDILQCDITPDILEVFQRSQQQRRQDWKQRLMNPISLRLPLWDPQEFLTRWLPLIRPVFGWGGLAVWAMVVLLGALYAGLYWDPITEDIVDRVLNPWNMVIMLFIYPVVKLLHELGHAFATRIWGGEVHELGIMFLVFMPIPYADATASAGFADKHQRFVVGAIGMMVEMFLAALALFVWINIETGIVSAIAYNIMVIGSISTLFFNGNPLLRFDGYYMLADAIEIPNLSVRAKRYLSYLGMRYLYGMHDVASPVEAHGEAAWFVGYGALSFLYRMAIMFVIIVYVAGQFFIIGMLLAIWAVILQIGLPLFRHIQFLLKDGRLQQQRVRALGVTATGIVAIGLMLFVMPAPLLTIAEGVVWLPEQSRLRAGTDCFVTAVLVQTDTAVEAGDAVVRCEDPLLSTQVQVLDARLRELQARHTLAMVEDRVEAQSIKQDMQAISGELALARSQIDKLVLRSPSAGQLVIPRSADLKGRFIHRGDTLAYILSDAAIRARVMVTQADIGLVRQKIDGVALRMAGRSEHTIAATVHSEVPEASDILPSKALGTSGGGMIPVHPDDDSGTRALATLFQLELQLQEEFPVQLYGQHVYARFDHGSEPLGYQWQRSIRQLFMREFGV